MTFLNFVTRAAIALILLTAVPTRASADWLLTPYLGVVFGGAANTLDIEDFDEEFQQRISFGASLAGMGGGVLGFEIDFNIAPNFFQITEGGDVDVFEIDSNLTTLMGNLIVGVPIGDVRPYFAAGAGLMRANIRAEDLFDDLSTNELGINFGGGVHVFFNDNVGFRGDLRYFRALQQDDEDPDPGLFEDIDLEDFDYWRATIGVTFRFGG